MVASMSGRVWQSLRQRGVTLIEAVLFIAIALGLIVGGIVFYQQAQFAGRMAKLVNLTANILTEASALALSYPMDPSVLMSRFGGGQDDLGDIFVKMGSIPEEYVFTYRSGRSIILHPWEMSIGEAGRIQVRVTTFGNAGQTNIQLNFLDLPAAACPRIVAFTASGDGLFGGGQTMVRFLRKDPNSQTGWSHIPGYNELGTTNGAVTGITPAEAAVFCRDAAPQGIGVHFQPGRL